jgi:hypothetical protein
MDTLRCIEGDNVGGFSFVKASFDCTICRNFPGGKILFGVFKNLKVGKSCLFADATICDFCLFFLPSSLAPVPLSFYCNAIGQIVRFGSHKSNPDSPTVL